MFYSKYIKRLLDIVISLIAIIILSPLLILLYILVRVKLGKPAIFKQVRPGKNEKLFTMYKFRTMTNEKDNKGKLLHGEKRLTDFGRKLRNNSLDELPELFNILKGDMSIIGPRPLLVEYLERYSDYQRQRHNVKPGLTGYAQAEGRNSISWEERFEKDIWYTKNISFATDFDIFLKTIQIVLRKDGIGSETSSIMEEFKGTGK